MDIEPRALGIFDEQRAGMTNGIARASVLCSVCWIQFLEMFSVSANQTRIASLPKMLLDTYGLKRFTVSCSAAEWMAGLQQALQGSQQREIVQSPKTSAKVYFYDSARTS